MNKQGVRVQWVIFGLATVLSTEIAVSISAVNTCYECFFENQEDCNLEQKDSWIIANCTELGIHNAQCLTLWWFNGVKNNTQRSCVSEPMADWKDCDTFLGAIQDLVSEDESVGCKVCHEDNCNFN